MHILFLSQLVPYPLNAGPKVRSYNVLRYLAKAGHAITLVAFRRDDDSDSAVAHLKQFCTAVHCVPMKRSRLSDAWHLGRSFVTQQPFLIARDAVQAMSELIQQLSAKTTFDAVHADQLWMAQYALSSGIRHRVLDQHNATFLIPARLAERAPQPLRSFWKREAKVMKRFETKVCQEFADVVWVTADDRTAFTPAQRGKTIPICVDTVEKALVRPSADPFRVTFVGGLHWPPNADGVRWFIEQVWPLVLAQAPDACLTLIGQRPPAALRAIADQPSIEMPGYVASLTPYLAQTAAFIVPLHAGGGMRVKILDAWAWGMPIVSTTIGAEGIEIEAGSNMLVADSAETFAQAVLALLTDPARRNAIASAGRSAVEADYDWRTTYPQWDTVYPRPN